MSEGAVPPTYKGYVRDRENPRFTDWLRDRSEPNWTRATTHEFTSDLASDTIDDAIFRRYLVQDYAFLGSLVSLVGYAVGQAPSMDAKRELSGFLATLTSEENDYFERAFDALEVPEADRTDPPLAPATRNFRTLIKRASYGGGYAETLAVLLPAEWVYREWAIRAADSTPDRFYLGEWIDLHATPTFESFVDWLRTELDREGEALSVRRQGRVDDLFSNTVELEVAFFDAAYTEP
ncbi:MAG: TenA family protein [Halobacteriales archaeon]|nr:TenA family protein [Halobacteriales archaeon]